jgi:hypothetical protein
LVLWSLVNLFYEPSIKLRNFGPIFYLRENEWHMHSFNHGYGI